MKTKIIVITGGVYSSLGKGIIASSIGCILKHGNFKISILKLDPYLNTNPGLLNPLQHGEVFITNDGCTTDLDLGHYERFICNDLNCTSTQTGGKLYLELLNDEKNNKYNGETIQIVPHLTNKIQKKINKAIGVSRPDFLIIEIGGTVGDIESLAFIEALRIYNAKNKNVLFIHCSPLLQISSNDEIKTKPTQHSIKTLRNLGINPSILVLRYNELILDSDRDKISWTCDIDKNNIFVSKECKNLYEVPLILFKQNIHKSILNFFKIKKNVDMTNWQQFVNSIFTKKINSVNVCICGKYAKLNDAYLSIIESLKLAGYKLSIDVKIDLVDLNELIKIDFKKYHGFIIADGELDDYNNQNLKKMINYCFLNNIKLIGIKFGMLAIANFFIHQNKKLNDLIFYNQEYISGRINSKITKKTLLFKIYEQESVNERHWNNWWLNHNFINEKNVIISCMHNELIDAIEISKKILLVLCIIQNMLQNLMNHIHYSLDW